jgi:putative Mg2+ transporter-C (MgtC) family protein
MLGELFDSSIVGTDLSALLRLVIAALLAGVIGWERETVGKAAGFRTHMLVGVASAMFIIMAELVMLEFHGNPGVARFDPVRAIAAVATGIGFLGGGTIFLAHGKDRVHGLTTAASIWATSAVGITVGLRHLLLATGATILLVIILRVMARLDQPAP